MTEKAGVRLRFLRELEQGKKSLRMDKVNQVLYLFGHELGPVKKVFIETEDDNFAYNQDQENIEKTSLEKIAFSTNVIKVKI